MKVLKRTSFFLIVFLFVSFSLWPRGQGARQVETPQDKTNLGYLGKYDPPIEVEVVQGLTITGYHEESFENAGILKFFEDQMGIKVKYKWATTPDQYNQRLALNLATGDLPDIFVLDMKTLGQVIESGQVQDITTVWERWASPLTKELMDIPGITGFTMATQNGRLYAIPEVTPVLETMHTLFIREDWRKKLNLPEPTTFENMERIFYAFANNDPDGNGKKDTYGIGLNKNIYGIGYEITSIANAMHAYPNAWIRDPDNKIVYGSVQPAMRPVLAKLAQWYKDGLIDREFTVKDEYKEAELCVKEQLGALFGLQWAYWISNGIVDNKSANPNSDWQNYIIPSIDNNPARPILYDNTKNFYVVREGYAHPEALMLILNMMHQIGAGDSRQYFKTREEFNAVWGNWTHSPVRPETVHGNIPKWENSLKALSVRDRSLVEYNYNALGTYDGRIELDTWLASMLFPWRDGITEDINRYKNTWGYQFSGRNFMMAQELAAKNLVTYEQCGALITPAMVDSLPSLTKLELETFTRIITGDAPVSEFDRFVASWNSMGGQRITQEINQWYATHGR
jgi:putative aldouronate transport system substrate-binding protein